MGPSQLRSVLLWDVSTFGPEPQLRRYVNHSPDELAAILSKLRTEYEHASAIRIESQGTKCVQALGLDVVQRAVVPWLAALAVMRISSPERLAVMCALGDEWKPLFVQLLRRELKQSDPDTLFRANTPLLGFMSAFINYYSDLYLEKLFGDDLADLSEAELLRGILHVPLPSMVRDLLSVVYGEVSAIAELSLFAMRAVGNLYFLRLVSPALVHAGQRTLAKAVMTTLIHHPGVVGHLEAVCKSNENVDENVFGADSFSSMSSLRHQNDDPLAVTTQVLDDLCLVGVSGVLRMLRALLVECEDGAEYPPLHSLEELIASALSQ